jgi:hypothetical protein
MCFTFKAAILKDLNKWKPSSMVRIRGNHIKEAFEGQQSWWGVHKRRPLTGDL